MSAPGEAKARRAASVRDPVEAEGLPETSTSGRASKGYLETVSFSRRDPSSEQGDPLCTKSNRKPLEATLAAGQSRDIGHRRRPALQGPTNDVARYTPLVAKQAVSQQELDDALSRAGRRASSQVEAGKAAVEKATLEPQLHPHRVAHRRAHRHHASEGRQPRRTRRKHAADHRVAEIESRAVPGRRHRSRLPPRSPDAAPGSAPARRPRAPGKGSSSPSSDGTKYPADGPRQHRGARGRSRPRAPWVSNCSFPTRSRSSAPAGPGASRSSSKPGQGALLVPQRAVQELQNLYSVALVDDSGKVAFRNVKVGQRVDSLWAIEEGHEPNEKVVVEGLQRIQDGMTVSAKPAPASAAPEAAAPAAVEAK